MAEAVAMVRPNLALEEVLILALLLLLYVRLSPPAISLQLPFTMRGCRKHCCLPRHILCLPRG